MSATGSASIEGAPAAGSDRATLAGQRQRQVVEDVERLGARHPPTILGWTIAISSINRAVHSGAASIGSATGHFTHSVP